MRARKLMCGHLLLFVWHYRSKSKFLPGSSFFLCLWKNKQIAAIAFSCTCPIYELAF